MGPPAGPERVPTAIDLEAAAVVTPLVAAAVLLVGLGLALSGRRR